MGEHPASCTDPACTMTYAEHLRGIAISAEATPNRRPTAAQIAAKDRRLDRDLDAYHRLRQDNVQPPHTDGCARLEATAQHRWDVESRPRAAGES